MPPPQNVFRQSQSEPALDPSPTAPTPSDPPSRLATSLPVRPVSQITRRFVRRDTHWVSTWSTSQRRGFESPRGTFDRGGDRHRGQFDQVRGRSEAETAKRACEQRDEAATEKMRSELPARTSPVARATMSPSPSERRTKRSSGRHTIETFWMHPMSSPTENLWAGQSFHENPQPPMPDSRGPGGSLPSERPPRPRLSRSMTSRADKALGSGICRLARLAPRGGLPPGSQRPGSHARLPVHSSSDANGSGRFGRQSRAGEASRERFRLAVREARNPLRPTRRVRGFPPVAERARRSGPHVSPYAATCG